MVETDASDKGIGAVLQQNGYPIAFVSRALVLKNQGLSTYEKESLAILMVVDHWRPYLQTIEFIIQTDQQSLIFLDDRRLNIYRQQKALTKLMDVQYKICYKKGTSNSAADALSRVSHSPDAELLSLSVAQPVWLQQLQESYVKDEKAKKMFAELTLHSPQGYFQLVQGIIKFKNRIWLGHSPQLQQQVMQALHCSPIGGHSGSLFTYIRIKKLFFWAHMKTQIQEFVASCSVCQQAKTEKVAYPGLLQPLSVPDQAWQVVTLDFFKDFLCLHLTIVCWWWWTSFLNTHILSNCLAHLQH